MSEIYQITKKSLQDKEYWQWRPHYYKYKKGTGIPYEISNDKIGITIWIANGPFSLHLIANSYFDSNSPSNFEKKYARRNGRSSLLKPEKKLPPLNIFQKWKLYNLAMKLFNETEFDINIDESILRDVKLNKLLKP